MRAAALLLVGFFFGWPANASYRICVPEGMACLVSVEQSMVSWGIVSGCQDFGRWRKEIGSICAVASAAIITALFTDSDWSADTGAVGARSPDHYALIPFGRVTVVASPMWTGPYVCQSRWLQ